jgi:hypothetical protein
MTSTRRVSQSREVGYRVNSGRDVLAPRLSAHDTSQTSNKPTALWPACPSGTASYLGERILCKRYEFVSGATKLTVFSRFWVKGGDAL